MSDHDDLFAQLEADLASDDLDVDSGDDTPGAGLSHRQIAVAMLVAFRDGDQRAYDTALTTVRPSLANASSLAYALADLAAASIRRCDDLPTALARAQVAAGRAAAPLASAVASTLVGHLTFYDTAHLGVGLLADCGTLWLSDEDPASPDPYDLLLAATAATSRALSDLAEQLGVDPGQLLRDHAAELADRL